MTKEELKKKKFKEVLNELYTTYVKKNHDYGDSFAKSIEEFGSVAGTIRITDKYNRLKSLTKDPNAQVSDETLRDTLLDMANYSIMMAIELERAGKTGEEELTSEKD